MPGFEVPKVLTAIDTPDETRPYRYETVYDVLNVDMVNLDALLQAWSSPKAKITLLLYRRLDFAAHEGKEVPAAGGIIVANSLTPQDTPEILEDYHAWYRQEHIHKLMKIPGWRTGSRYQLLDQRGEMAEYAGPFMAVHQYDEDNALGGTEWTQSIVSEWTKKIDQRMAKRPHRRVFKIDRVVSY
ncbi:uncharacterized protein Z518_07405 [Rhinocladiella mackenziei CBS 650.93]|uniref:EthD domain-containing protein n=1 Tax=Rhinocladiella mackenziei CBS 650.93 TaxID=1442369 RepID=A0A0D2FP02_9EURO|nr:uncharacterized protein Z518_07405 [Rhinocladiella mackenziei CBS 650.93]KIX03852.1 hypothetical protein Z518_07405 [Rhinocladiella mackenziei CBS 650.93]